MTEGFLYIATGDSYVEQAKMSAQNTRKHTDRPIALVSDRDVDAECFDEVIVDQNPRYSYIDKVRNLCKSPFERTVFLDTDAYILTAVPELFDMLDHVDIATTIDPNELGGRLREDVHFRDIPESVPIYQTGVIAFEQNRSVRDFVERWERIHTENIDGMLTDQSSFRIAIYGSDVTHLACSSLYNCLATSPMQVTGEVKIIHANPLNSTNVEKIGDRINRSHSKRLLYTPRDGEIHSPTSTFSHTVLTVVDLLLRGANLLFRSARSIVKSGVRQTLRKIFDRYSNRSPNGGESAQ